MNDTFITLKYHIVTKQEFENRMVWNRLKEFSYPDTVIEQIILTWVRTDINKCNHNNRYEIFRDIVITSLNDYEQNNLSIK